MPVFIQDSFIVSINYVIHYVVELGLLKMSPSKLMEFQVFQVLLTTPSKSGSRSQCHGLNCTMYLYHLCL